VVHVSATDALRFSPATIRVRPGLVRLVFDVQGPKPQTFTSSALRVDTGHVGGGETRTFDVVVPRAGKYRFVSTYHQREGMRGTIVATRS
jgi:plastocyanin